METKNLLKKLNNYRPGTFVKVCWEKDISSANAKKNGITIMKHYEAIVRTGINYRNIKEVAINDNANKNSNNEHKSSWYKHSDIKGVVQHKEDENKKYLQVFPVKGKEIKTKIVATVDENKLEKLYELGLITKAGLNKQYSKLEENEVIVKTISFDNITKFGK